MKKVRIFALAAVAGALFACQKSGSTDNTPVTAQGIPTKMTLSVNFNANGGSSLSRALNGNDEAGTAAENAVQTIEFYVFTSAGALDTAVGTGNGYIEFTDGVLSKEVIVSSGTETFVALVNMNLGPLAAGQTLADLQAKLSTGQFTITAGSENARAIPTTGLEMSGQAGATIVANSITNSVSIAVSRLVSKMNAPTFSDGLVPAGPAGITLTDAAIQQLWPGTTTITNADLTFNPTGWVVVNGLDKSGVLFTGNAAGDDTDPLNVPWDTWTATGKAYLASTFDATGAYTANYSGYGNADFFLGLATPPVVYVYENAPQKITVSGQTGYDPQDVYAFIVKGDIIVDGDATNTNGLNQTRFWRVDLVRDNDYHIMRNASYHVNISSIATPGYGTPQDAEQAPDIIPDANSTAVTITVVVNPWRINTTDTPM